MADDFLDSQEEPSASGSGSGDREQEEFLKVGEYNEEDFSATGGAPEDKSVVAAVIQTSDTSLTATSSHPVAALCHVGFKVCLISLNPFNQWISVFRIIACFARVVCVISYFLLGIGGLHLFIRHVVHWQFRDSICADCALAGCRFLDCEERNRPTARRSAMVERGERRRLDGMAIRIAASDA